MTRPNRGTKSALDGVKSLRVNRLVNDQLTKVENKRTAPPRNRGDFDRVNGLTGIDVIDNPRDSEIERPKSARQHFRQNKVNDMRKQVNPYSRKVPVGHVKLKSGEIVSYDEKARRDKEYADKKAEIGKARLRNYYANNPDKKRGRVKGQPNKINALLKEAIVTAIALEGSDQKGRDGLIGWLRLQSREQPKEYLRLVGKVLPLQINTSSTDAEGNQPVTIEEFGRRLQERGLPLPPSLAAAIPTYRNPETIDVTPNSERKT